MTISDDIQAYKYAYADFFGHPYPIVTRNPGGGVTIRLVEGDPMRWTMMELRMMTALYRGMLDEVKAA